MVLNRYLDRIRAFEEDNNQTGVYYVYALIFRKVYLYDMPEIDEEDFVYDPDEYARDSSNVNDGILRVLSPNFEVVFEESQKKSQKPENSIGLRDWVKGLFK